MTAKSFLKTPWRALQCNGGHGVSIFITPARVCMRNKFSNSVTPVADRLRGDDK